MADSATSERSSNWNIGVWISLATIIFSIIQFAISSATNKRERQLAKAKDDKAYDIEAFKSVMAALGSHDSTEQYAAISLAGLVNDTSLRRSLLAALGKSTLPAIRDTVTHIYKSTATFDSTTRASLAPGAESGWRYDVFVCEGAPAGMKAQADSIRQALAVGTDVARVRSLPQWINLSSGYRVSGYQIRYEDSESSQADLVKQKLEQAGIRIAFVGHTVGSPTKRYISLFLCP